MERQHSAANQKVENFVKSRTLEITLQLMKKEGGEFLLSKRILRGNLKL